MTVKPEELEKPESETMPGNEGVFGRGHIRRAARHGTWYVPSLWELGHECAVEMLRKELARRLGREPDILASTLNLLGVCMQRQVVNTHHIYDMVASFVRKHPAAM